jgi:hypothetical protein
MMDIVRSRQDNADRLSTASKALSTIMFSSAYNSFIDPEFKDVIDFEEFSEVFDKLMDWSMEYENKLNLLNSEKKSENS